MIRYIDSLEEEERDRLAAAREALRIEHEVEVIERMDVNNQTVSSIVGIPTNASTEVLEETSMSIPKGVEKDLIIDPNFEWEFALPNSWMKREEDIVYVIRQLMNEEELILEGEEMNHCVASYYSNCLSEESSIWSLSSMDENEEWEKLATIELNEDQVIIEMRGENNRDLELEHWEIVKEWAEEHELEI